MTENFYKRLMEKSPTGYALHKINCDQDGIPCDYEFIEVNAAFEKFTGLLGADIVGRKISTVIPEMIQSEFDWIHFYGDIAINGGEKEFELFHKPWSKWFRVNVHSPEKEYFITHLTDISNEKSQLEALKKINTEHKSQNEYAEILLNTIPSAVFSVDKECKITSWNKKAEDITGYKSEEIIGENCKLFALEPCKEKCGLISEDVEKPIIGKVFTIKNKQGNILTLSKNVDILKDYEGNVIGGIECFEDVTQKKQMEEELTKITQRLKLATKAANVGIWEYDLVNNTLIWDDAMYRLYGISKEDFSGAYEAWEQGLHPDDLESSRQHINDAVLGIRDFNPEFRVIWKDGSVHTIKANAMVLKDEHGKPVKMFGTNWDISDRIKYESALIMAKELAESATIMKSQFLANMSHEIRTPMNGILGYLDLLHRTNLSSEQKEFIREAKSASEILLYLINDILDFSKIEAGKLTIEKTNFNIRTTIEDAVSLLVPKACEKHLELHTMIKSNVPEEVIGDPARLRQIINNLVSNAVKFTEQGEISIVVSCDNVLNNKALIQFEVKDTGIGICQDALNMLFTPFTQADSSTTRKFGGTGLGLAICKELVKLMDGEISVESKTGQGSVFKFSISLEVTKKATCIHALGNLKGENVLVVDDNEVNRKIVRCYLEETGCRIFEAEGADKAITTILMNANTENKIGLAILDYQMPGMNGYQLASTLSTIPTAKDVKMILLTSAALKGDVKDAKEYGFSGYLTKPVKRDDLLNCIAIVLGLKKEEETDTQVVTKHTINEVKRKLTPRILLVEDNEINRKIILTMLKSHNLNCDVALNGAEAVKALLKKEYDIVFMDCQMPIMDGYEATRKIRANEGSEQHTPIIAMTANAMQGDKAKCLDAGMDDYISKPIDFDYMFKLIEAKTKFLEQHSKYFDFIDDNIDRFINITGLQKEDATEIFQAYISYLPTLLERIQESITVGDYEKLKELAHQLKGSSGNLRIALLQELAGKLEESANNQEKEHCEKLFSEIQQLFH